VSIMSDMHNMLWGIIKVDLVVPGDWKLLAQSIQEKPMDAIEAAEYAYGNTWENLKAIGYYMIRLRLMPDGQPADMVFAWAENVWVKATGVQTYEEYCNQRNMKKYEDKPN